MIIFIKLLDGTKHEFNVNENIRITQLKYNIQEILNINKRAQRLLYKGYPMLDDYTLGSYNVTENSTIFLLLQLF
jgi:hypothetical protein